MEKDELTTDEIAFINGLIQSDVWVFITMKDGDRLIRAEFSNEEFEEYIFRDIPKGYRIYMISKTKIGMDIDFVSS